MKKNVVTAIFFILCVMLSACKGESQNNTNQVTVNKNQLDIYNINSVSLDKQYAMATIAGNMIYGVTTNQENPIVTIQEKNTGKIISEILIPLTSASAEIQSLSADDSNNIFITINNEELKSSIWKINTDGNISEFTLPILEDTETARFLSIKKVEVDSDGRFFIWSEMALPAKELEEVKKELDDDSFVMVDRIYIKDVQLNTLFYVQVLAIDNVALRHFYIGENNNPAVIISESNGLLMREIDLELNSLSKDSYPLGIGAYDLDTIAITENGILYSSGGSLYQLDINSKKTEMILHWASYGINQSDILYLARTKSSIELIDTYQEVSGYVKLSEGDIERTVITIGLLQLSQDVEKVIAEFSRKNPDIAIDIKTYFQEDGDFDQALEKLKLDIVTGDAPDIIEVSMINCEQFADKGIFEDIGELIRNDDSLDQDLIIPSVLNAYEVEGKLLNVAPCFQLYSMWGSKDNLGNREGNTLNELMELLESKGKTIDAISGFSMDEPVLTTLCTSGVDEFIDWKTGNCDFTGSNFRDLLRFAKEYSGGYREGSTSQGISNGDILLSVGIISSVADYQIQSELYGDELTFVGYPTSKENGTSIGYRGSELAISSKSEYKGAAWDFVKFYLLNGYDGQGFPVTSKQFDEVMEKAQQEDVELFEGEPMELPKGLYSDGDSYFEVYQADAEDVKNVSNLVAKTENCFKYDVDILNIITEEAEAYFNDQKSIEDTVEIIQSRVMIYLKERVG